MKSKMLYLYLPPYLSTPWENVMAMHVKSVEVMGKKSFTLVVTMPNHAQSEIPGLNQETIEHIFESYKAFLERLGVEAPEAAEEEIVTDEELTFKDEWEVKKIGENLYRVENPLDKNEYYQVYLGNTIGCTCAKEKCEHVKAVLKT